MYRIDKQLWGPQLRYFVSDLKSNDILQKQMVAFENAKDVNSLLLKKNSVGQLLLEHLSLKHYPFVVFIQFCAEGDNLPDAIYVAQNISKYLNFQKGKFAFETFQKKFDSIAL